MSYDTQAREQGTRAMALEQMNGCSVEQLGRNVLAQHTPGLLYQKAGFG